MSKHMRDAGQTGDFVARGATGGWGAAPDVTFTHGERWDDEEEYERRRRGAGCLVVLVVCILLVAALGVCSFMLATSAGRVAEGARAARDEAGRVVGAFVAGDAAGLKQATDELVGEVGRMGQEVDGPLWAAASHVPVVGRDVACVREMVAVAGDLSTDVVVPLSEALAGRGVANLFHDRAVDCDFVGELCQQVTVAAPAVKNASRRLDAMELGVIEPVRAVAHDLTVQIGDAADLLDKAGPLSVSTLSLLGTGGPRTYLLCALGNSEARASGGMPGSVGVLTLDHGAISLEDFRSVHQLQSAVWEAGFAASVTEEERLALGEEFATDAAYVTSSPDFSRVAEVVREMWQTAFGVPIDGVIAMDPVFLQRVLAVIGGVVAEDGTLVDGQTCAFELLSNAYWRYGYETNANELEDAFFADVATKSFDHFFDALPTCDASALGEAMAASVRDRRLQVWVADETMEQLIEDAGLSGKVTSDGMKDTLGIYVNDLSWNKLCWYLDVSSEMERVADAGEGRAEYDVAVHFANSITEDEASRAPSYISQMYQPLKRAPSDLVESVLVMAPEGGLIEDLVVHPDAPIGADKTIEDLRLSLYGRDTVRTRINILGEKVTTVTFRLVMPPASTEAPDVVCTPLCHD